MANSEIITFMCMRWSSLIVLVLLVVLVKPVTGQDRHISWYVEREAMPAMLQALLGPVYGYREADRVYYNDKGTEVRTVELPHAVYTDTQVDKIAEIFLSGKQLERPPVSGSIVYGLKPGNKFDHCVEVLQEHVAVTYVEPDVEGAPRSIAFGYKRVDGKEVHFELIFARKKSKWLLNALRVRNAR